MHNIKDLRTNIDNFKKLIENRNADINFQKILDLDKDNRSLIQEKEQLEMEKKTISKSKDKSLFSKSKEIKTLEGIERHCSPTPMDRNV